MRNYPFCDNGDLSGSANGTYDVHFRPEVFPTFDEYTASSNSNLYWPNGTDGTIDYSLSHQVFSEAECGGNIIPVLPTDPVAAIWSDPIMNINGALHIPPYSIVWSPLLNADGTSMAGLTSNGTLPGSTGVFNTGIQHTYHINNADITQINPGEKIIYNPSEAIIDGSELFPSGYTFRTVYGIYPLRSDVEAFNTIHWNLYDHLSDVPTPIKSNESPSIYHVQAPLTIDPCVRIMDADFIIEGGGSVTYDPAQTYGNFTFSGNTAAVNAVSLPECNCKLKCYEPSFYDEKDILINTNTTWAPGHYDYINYSGSSKNVANSFIRIAGTLEIAADKTLTLAPGCRLEFGHQGKIIIKPRGKLIINGTSGSPVVLTSACELMWDGITLEKYQGALCAFCNINDYRSELEAENLIVENADIAVLSKGMGDYNTGKTNYPSGIITANNCTFRNNRIDLQFNSYKRFINQNPVSQGSLIRNCVFETTQPLLENTRVPRAADSHAPDYHIYLSNVHNIILRNNSFYCNTTHFAPHERGTGIYSENAYLITGELFPNTFEGLTEGIWASHTGTPDYVCIRGNTFTNCIHAAVLEGTMNSLIVHNTFNIPGDEAAYDYEADDTRRGYDKPVGLYLRECRGFRVEENTFNGPGTTPVDEYHYSYGIVANSIGGNDYPDFLLTNFVDGFGSIYRNVFNDNHIALQSELDNLGTGYDPAHPAGTGLFIGCNDFNNSEISSINIVGIKFGDNPMSPVSQGKLRNQGWTTIQAPRGCDNRFSGSPTDYDINFNSNTEYNIYSKLYYCYSNSNFPGYRINPAYDNANPKLQPVFINTATYSCPSNYIGPAIASVEEIAKEIEENTAKQKAAEDDYAALVDGGNTTLLTNMIAAHSPAGQVRNTLLQYSPYLSDEVLTSVIDPSGHMVPGIISQVLSANSPLTKTVIDTMEGRYPALPPGIVNQILSVQSGISERAKLESNMDYYAFSDNMLYADLFRAGIEELKLDSVIIKLETDTSKANSVNLFPVYMAAGNAEKADSVFSVIKNMAADSNSYEITMQSINLKMLTDTLTPAELDNNTLVNANMFILNNPEQAFKTKALMRSARDKRHKRDPYVNVSENNRSMETNPSASVNEKTVFFNVYPNPASDRIFIQSSLNGEYECILYNQLGEALVYYNMEGTENSIDLGNIEPGVYHLLIIRSNNVIQTEKVVIIK